MDAPLMFEVLLYLNGYYFAVFAGSEMLIVYAKFNSPNLPTPNIDIDGAVVGGILVSELIKVTSFNRLRLERKCLSDFVAQFNTGISIFGLLYIFTLQNPVLKIEYIVCGIMLILLLTEFTYGFLQFVPCCKKKQYAE